MALFFGLDVNQDTLRVARVRVSYRRVAVELVQEELLASEQAQASVLQGAIRPLCTKGNDLCVSFPGDSIFVRRVDLPNTAARQLGQLLPFELEAQLPFEIDEVVYAYRPLPRTSNDNQIHVLAVAAPIRKVTALIDTLRQSLDHEPERIEPSAFALANLIPHVAQFSSEQPIAIVHVDTRATDLLVLQGGEARFARTFRHGTSGLPQSGSRLAMELRQSILAWRADGGEPIDKLYVTGPGASLQGVTEFFAGHLQLPTELAPLPAVEGPIAQQPEQLHKFIKPIALALGLASRPKGFNLRAGPLAYERGYGFLKEKIPLASGLTVLLVLSFLFSNWMRSRALTAETEMLRRSLGQVTLDVLGKKIVDPQEAIDAVAVSRSKLLDPMPKLDAFDVMVAMAEVVPPDVPHDIEELDVQKGHVTIHGVVPTIPDAQNIANELKKRPCFKNLKIVRTNKVVNQDKQKYVLEFELNCGEDKKKKKKRKHKKKEAQP